MAGRSLAVGESGSGVNHPSAVHKTKLLIEEWIITQQEIFAKISTERSTYQRLLNPTAQ